MTRPNKQKVWQAAAFIAGVAVLWIHLDDFGNSEFIGGWLTGKIFSLADFGGILFLFALLLTVFLPRVASAVALLASLLCLPLYLYVVAPGPFRRIFKGAYSVSLQHPFVWDWSAMSGIATLVFAATCSIYALRSLRSFKQP